MEKVFINDGIISMGIYREIKYLKDTRDCIKDVCITYHNPEIFCYLSDMMSDGYELTCYILKYRTTTIPDNLVKKINKWYNACESLLYDIRVWLRDECGYNPYEFLRKGGVFNGN